MPCCHDNHNTVIELAMQRRAAFSWAGQKAMRSLRSSSLRSRDALHLSSIFILSLSRARIFIARKSRARRSSGHAFLARFNRNTARKRYPYCQGYNGFWSVVHPVEYAQSRHGRHSVISSCRTTVVHERGSLAIIDRFPPGPAFTWS